MMVLSAVCALPKPEPPELLVICVLGPGWTKTKRLLRARIGPSYNSIVAMRISTMADASAIATARTLRVCE